MQVEAAGLTRYIAVAAGTCWSARGSPGPALAPTWPWACLPISDHLASLQGPSLIQRLGWLPLGCCLCLDRSFLGFRAWASIQQLMRSGALPHLPSSHIHHIWPDAARGPWSTGKGNQRFSSFCSHQQSQEGILLKYSVPHDFAVCSTGPSSQSYTQPYHCSSAFLCDQKHK